MKTYLFKSLNLSIFLFSFYRTYRISNRLDGLTTSLIAWKQFESGLTEFKEALGKDKGALKGLTGALEMGNDAGDALTLDVKEVAKRLSEKIENQQQQQQQVSFFFS